MSNVRTPTPQLLPLRCPRFAQRDSFAMRYKVVVADHGETEKEEAEEAKEEGEKEDEAADDDAPGSAKKRKTGGSSCASGSRSASAALAKKVLSCRMRKTNNFKVFSSTEIHC